MLAIVLGSFAHRAHGPILKIATAAAIAAIAADIGWRGERLPGDVHGNVLAIIKQP